MFKVFGIRWILVVLCGPVWADAPGASSCGSDGVDGHGVPCSDGQTTVGASSKTPFSGGGGRGTGGGR